MEINPCKTCIYKEMYFHLAKASEDSVRILIKAQQECEDILLDDDAPCLKNISDCQCPGNCELP